MRPVLFNIGPLPIHTYGLLLAIGFLLGLYLLQRDARRFGLNPDALSDMAFGALVSGIIGARLMHIIMFPQNYSWSDPLGWIAIWRGGLVFQGGFLLAAAFCVIYAHFRKLPYGKTIDVSLPYLPLAHAIGRLGCFFGVGCCYGAPTSMPWGVCFPRVPADLTVPAEGSEPFQHYGPGASNPLWTDPIHPTQLYESAGLLLIFGLLLLARKRWHPFPGFVLPGYMVLYGVLRFIVEMFRGDGNPVRVAHMTDQQVISVLTVVIGLVAFLLFMRRPAKPAAAS